MKKKINHGTIFLRKITVSAPGKLMLLGEHAVVYGKPCIVTAVNQRMKAAVELIEKPVFQLNAPDVNVLDYKKPMNQLGDGDPSTSLVQKDSTGIPKGAKFVEIAVKNFTQEHPIADGIKVTTTSEFSSLFGFGSSSASTVCVIKALSELTGADLDRKAIFNLAYKTVLDIQGKGSGFDVAAATFGGTLYFVTGGKVIEPLSIDNLPLVVGYSGIKADTVTLINQVSEKARQNPQIVESIYDSIGKLVDQAKSALLAKDWLKLGLLMDADQNLLIQLGVSIQKLDKMISAARDSGAYGAKLSGAGGGDCMIALTPEDKIQKVKDAITSVGGQIINVRASVEGVKIEP